MGFAYAEVEVSNPVAPEMRVAITMLADTGATFSVLPHQPAGQAWDTP